MMRREDHLTSVNCSNIPRFCIRFREYIKNIKFAVVAEYVLKAESGPICGPVHPHSLPIHLDRCEYSKREEIDIAVEKPGNEPQVTSQ
jgi:hypothetical protein